MTLATVESIDKIMDWSRFDHWKIPTIGASYDTEPGQVVIHAYQGRCDHETCYETHDTQLVFAIGDRYFLKAGTYDSSDGFQWNRPLREVQPVEKKVVGWDVVVPRVWGAVEISEHLSAWMKTQPKPRWSQYDWETLYYASMDGLEVPGLPHLVVAAETWENHEPESNGPVWLIFQIGPDFYAAKGRNVSHSGWVFDGAYQLHKVTKQIVTREEWQ